MSVGRLPKQDKDRLNNRVEHFRTRANLSRQELADAVGVHYQTVGYIERGEYAPTLALALRMAEALNCTIEQLFQLQGKK
jgi:DNA-binding XRE family transcriptional regulator